MGFNKSISILLATLILLGSFQQGLDIAIFKLSQSVIIENYCINKNQKEFKCDGKCHLSKVMAQQQKESHSDKSFVPEYRSFVFVVTKNEQPINYENIIEHNLSKIITHESEGHYLTLIKPPSTIG